MTINIKIVKRLIIPKRKNGLFILNLTPEKVHNSVKVRS